MRFKTAVLALLLMLTAESAFAQTLQDRLKVLEAEIQRLQQEVEDLKREAAATRPSEEANAPANAPAESRAAATKREFSDQILVPDLGR